MATQTTYRLISIDDRGRSHLYLAPHRVGRYGAHLSQGQTCRMYDTDTERDVHVRIVEVFTNIRTPRGSTGGSPYVAVEVEIL